MNIEALDKRVEDLIHRAIEEERFDRRPLSTKLSVALEHCPLQPPNAHEWPELGEAVIVQPRSGIDAV